MLFGIIVLATAMSYLLPAGSFDRQLVDGRQRVIPGTFKYLPQSPLSFLDMFVAFAKGFKTASDIIWIVLTSGIMFGILQKSQMIEHAVGSIVKQLGLRRKYLIVVLMTFVFGMLGVGVGYENNIALVPIGAILAMAIGGDLILAVGISVAAITIGFGLSPTQVDIVFFCAGHVGVLQRALLQKDRSRSCQQPWRWFEHRRLHTLQEAGRL